MKTIIVPIDFSEQAANALKVAGSLAKRHGSEILVLHMLELNQAIISSTEGFYQEHTVFLLKLAEKRMKEFLAKPYLEGIKVTPIIKHFKVFGEVNDIAEKHKADLVIMGSHGTDGLKEIFVGSNAEKVVRHSDIPVLVIKDEISDFKVSDFVFANDYQKENIPAFNRALEFAKKLNARFHLVYINTPGDQFLSNQDIHKRVAEFQQQADSSMEVEIYNDYNVELGVLNYSESINADIIGIPTHGRKGLSHFFMGSIGEDVANHSTIPVITFKL